jgi:dolichol-phosphate mannosyltransferase
MRRTGIRKLPLGRLVRFGLVGVSGIGVNLGVFWGVRALLASSVGDATLRFEIAHVAGVVVSILTNFLLNDRWTWAAPEAERGMSFPRRMAAFYGVSLVGAAVQLGTAWACRQYLPVTETTAVLGGIALATLFNFVANDRITFRRRVSEAGRAR